jgi:hypothetical protein
LLISIFKLSPKARCMTTRDKVFHLPLLAPQGG